MVFCTAEMVGMARSGSFSKNFYQIFGLNTDATVDEIKKKYQKLVLKFHPDKFNAVVSKVSSEEAREIFHQIDNAWKILSNPETKTEYDATLREVEVTQEWPVDQDVDLSDMVYDEGTNEYSWSCRCSGSYIVTEDNLEKGENIVCCSTCTLTIRILFTILEDE